MATRDVPVEEWPEFLLAFSRQHHAWLATIEEPGDTRSRREANARPLANVTAEQSGNRVRAIEIAFAPESGASAVRVENPTAVRLQQTDAGADRALEIVDKAGHCTRLGFRAAAIPEMVDGLAPGEFDS